MMFARCLASMHCARRNAPKSAWRGNRAKDLTDHPHAQFRSGSSCARRDSASCKLGHTVLASRPASLQCALAFAQRGFRLERLAYSHHTCVTDLIQAQSVPPAHHVLHVSTPPFRSPAHLRPHKICAPECSQRGICLQRLADRRRACLQSCCTLSCIHSEPRQPARRLSAFCRRHRDTTVFL